MGVNLRSQDTSSWDIMDGHHSMAVCCRIGSLLVYRVVAWQVISSSCPLEQMQIYGVQYQSPVTTDIDGNKCFALHTIACLQEDDVQPPYNKHNLNGMYTFTTKLSCLFEVGTPNLIFF